MFKSIASRLILLTLSGVVVAVLVGVMSYTSSRSALIEKSKSESKTKVELIASTMDKVIDGAIQITQAAVAGQDSGVEDKIAFVKGLIPKMPETYYQDVYISYIGKDLNTTDGLINIDRNSYPNLAKVEYDEEGTKWFFEEIPQKPGEVKIFEPYYDPGVKYSMTGVGISFFDRQGRLIGLAGADISLAALEKELTELGIGAGPKGLAGQYAYLLSPSGVIVTHPDPKSLPDEANDKGYPGTMLPGGKEIAKADSGCQFMPFKDGSKLVTWVRAPKHGWKIVSVVPESQITADSIALAKKAGLATLVASVLLSFVGWLVANSMTRPLRALTESSQKLARGESKGLPEIDASGEFGILANSFRQLTEYQRETAQVADDISRGDLTRDHRPRSGEDLLGVALGRMIAKLRGTMTEIEAQAGETERVGADLQATSDAALRGALDIDESVLKVKAVSEQSSGSARELATAADKMSANAAQAQSAVSDLSESISEVSQAARDQVGQTDSARSAVENGQAEIGRLLESMDSIQSDVGRSVQVIRDLDAKQSQVGHIIETIQDIAGQTNLLALNAAIEAARAGDQGKGFAVVADEVRKLAERSAEATTETGALIESIQQGIRDVIAAMNVAVERVDEGAEAGQSVRDALETIVEATDRLGTLASGHSKLVERMATSAGSVSNLISEVAGQTQQTAAASEELSAMGEELDHLTLRMKQSLDEQRAGMERLTATSNAMNDQARRLHDQSTQFSLPAQEEPPALRVA